MSEHSPPLNQSPNQPSNPPYKRRAWLQFGTRTLFVLIVAAAFAAWFAQREMAKEQRREETIAALQGNGNQVFLDRDSNADWRRRLGAWLRGKAPTSAIRDASLNRVDDPAIICDLVQLFSDAKVSLNVNSSKVTPQLLDALAAAKEVESLNIFGTPFDASVASLGKLGKIRVNRDVTFGSKHLDDDLLRRVADAKIELGWIWDWSHVDESQGWTLVTNDGLKTASRFRKLHMVVGNRKGSDEGFAAFKDHPTVGTVELIGSGYTDASADVIASLPRLGSLLLADTRLTDAGIAKAIAARELSSLRLRRADVGEKTIAAIAEMPIVTGLELHDVPLLPELVAAISKHPIGSLNLRGDYTDADLERLAPLAPNLREVIFVTPHVTDDGLKWLADAGQLYEVGLINTQATVTTMKRIKTWSFEVSVGLGGPNIDAEVVAGAQRAGNIRSISLNGETIDDSVLAAIEPRYNGFNQLSLAGTRTTAAGLRSLKMAGNKISVNISYSNDEAPPLTQQEIDDIKQATSGLVEVSQLAIGAALFEQIVPRSSRRPTAEGATP